MGEQNERLVYDEVAIVCNFLESIHSEPTSNKILAILQRGSLTTIGKHLQTWRDTTKLATTINPNIIQAIEKEINYQANKLNYVGYQELDSIKKQNSKLTKENTLLKEQLMESARELEKIKRESENEITLLKTELSKLKKECASLSKQFDAKKEECIKKDTMIEINNKHLLELQAAISSIRNEKDKLLVTLGEQGILLKEKNRSKK